jgi:hypothetical protein
MEGVASYLMAFVDDVVRHAEQIRGRLPHLRGEEATKHSLVIPLLHLLGWDPFDPREVTPEYTADFATKRGGQLEKIDYAIMVGGAPAIFFECKAHDQTLTDHTGQLARYFNSTPSVRIGVITNGVRLQVFTDLTQSNVMDATPWIDIDLLGAGQIELEALRRLRKADFSTDDITAYAERMVYFRKMADYMAGALREPNESFVRFVAGEVFPQVRLMPKVVERLTPIFKDAIQAAVLDSVAKSFGSSSNRDTAPPPLAEEKAIPEENPSTPEKDRGIETTADEIRCFEIVSTMIHEARPEATVGYRDSQNYFGIHQGSTRKWFLRVNVQKPPCWLVFRHVTPEDLKTLAPGVASGTSSLGDSRVSVAGPDDLQKLRSAIISAFDRETARGAEDDASA